MLIKMDIRNYFSRKRDLCSDSSSDDPVDLEPDPSEVDLPTTGISELSSSSVTLKPAAAMSKGERKKVYKANLSYKKQWEQKYPWVYCTDVKQGMFCKLCQQRGNPPSTARGAWTSRGIKDWNHATELLKQHSKSHWHRDAIVYCRMAEQGRSQSVLEMHCSAAAKELEERKERNKIILLKLFRSVYFLVKNRIPHTNTLSQLVELQVANGDLVLKKHVDEGALNAQYTSKFSAVMLMESIDSWINLKLLESLKASSFFSILADECEDISTKEELTICFRWIKEGKPEEHFLNILRIRSLDAATIADAICSFMESNNLDYSKMIGQGYDGAATFAGCKTGVQQRMRVHAPHAMYIHCSCHRLQLASVQAAESIPEIKKVYVMMGNLWKFFYYSPKKAEALKEIQCALNFPELKIVKPSDTRWLSHERCVRAIRREFPALVTTLQQLYETSGDAEAYGLSMLLASQVGVASIMLLSEILDILAKLSAAMQTKVADFSKIPNLLKVTIDSLKALKEESSDWVALVTTAISKLETNYGITVSCGYGSTRSHANITNVSAYRTSVAIPYIDIILKNINERFSNEAVKILQAMSIFNPALLSSKESLSTYGDNEITILANFYGKPAEVKFNGVSYSSPPLLNREDLLSEWKIFRRALLQERNSLVKSKCLTKVPHLQELLQEMTSSDAYTGIFPEIFKLIDIMLALPIGTATAERSFSQMKQIKTRLRNRISDENLPRLMRIAIEGPELTEVDFNEVLDIFKKQNHRIVL